MLARIKRFFKIKKCEDIDKKIVDSVEPQMSKEEKLKKEITFKVFEREDGNFEVLQTTSWPNREENRFNPGIETVAVVSSLDKARLFIKRRKEFGGRGKEIDIETGEYK